MSLPNCPHCGQQYYTRAELQISEDYLFARLPVTCINHCISTKTLLYKRFSHENLELGTFRHDGAPEIISDFRYISLQIVTTNLERNHPDAIIFEAVRS